MRIMVAKLGDGATSALIVPRKGSMKVPVYISAANHEELVDRLGVELPKWYPQVSGAPELF